MPSRDLRVETAGVHAAGATTAAAASSAALLLPPSPRCAGDATSAKVATRAAGQIGALGLATAAANVTTEAAATRLHGGADAYEFQEASGATSLGDVTAAVGGGVDAPPVSTPQLPTSPQLPGIPLGITPTTGHEIAAVIHPARVRRGCWPWPACWRAPRKTSTRQRHRYPPRAPWPQVAGRRMRPTPPAAPSGSGKRLHRARVSGPRACAAAAHACRRLLPRQGPDTAAAAIRRP